MKKINEMTIKEKIGQLVFAGFSGYVYDDHIKKLIEEYKLGNIILFTRNIDNIKQLHYLNDKLYQEIIKNTGVIPFISIDQEGGMVTRIMKEATFCPGNMSLGATGPQNSYLIGQVSGKELRSLGINMNLAPSLDVNNNPLNPVIGVRSYSDNPQVVSDYGLNYIRGLQEQGIIATAKHFPGHGDTATDSHYSLPIVPHNKQRLNEIELVPFKNAIREKVDAIMSAHVFFTAYEEDNLPATLSKKVLTDLLRKELGFEGLIVSDCMEMKAIDDNYTTSKGALMGLLAGLDMVFVSATLSKQIETLQLIEEAVNDGRFPIELLDEKVARVLKYKEKIYPIIKKYFLDLSYEEKYNIITNPKSKQLASKIVDNSLTLVKGKNFYPNKNTLVIATEPFATTIAEDEISTRSIIDAIISEKLPFDTVKIKVNLHKELIEQLVEKVRYYGQVVICTYNAHFSKSQVELVKRVNQVVEDLFVISTRNPYDILSFPEIKNYLCLYEYTPNSVQTIVHYLNKKITPIGKLPIKLKSKPEIGASLYVGLKEYSLEDNLKYLEILKSHNINLIFISAHIPEMKAGFEKDLQTVIAYANKLEMKIVLDVSKPMMEKFKIPNIYSLRLDYGFSNEEIINLYHDNEFLIELNASTVTKEQLDYFVMSGMDLSRVRVSHNFYPKPETGLTADEVVRRNKVFKNYGLKVMGYIPSKNQQRPPLYEGLVTVESHRKLPLEAILSEMKLLGFDEIVFGDSYASEIEIVTAINFDFDIIQIPVVVEPSITKEERNQLELLHRNRLDMPEAFIRSSTRTPQSITPKNTIVRKFGDVTIDNNQYLRYQGEVSVVLKDLPAEKRVNVVGHVAASRYLIENINPGDKFKLIIIGDNNEKSHNCC